MFIALVIIAVIVAAVYFARKSFKDDASGSYTPPSFDPDRDLRDDHPGDLR